MKLAQIQMHVTADKAANLRHAEELLRSGIFRWRATQAPCGSKTKEVLYTRPSSSSGREPPTSHSPSSRAVRESI